MSSYLESAGSDEEDDYGMNPGRKRQRQQKPTPNKRARFDRPDGSSSLFDQVMGGKNVPRIVDVWVEHYQSNRTSALLSLVQFFVNSSGCKGLVTMEMLQKSEQDEGFADIIKRMTEEFDEDSGDYPLIATGIVYKRFKHSFCDFIEALVKQCQYQIIYDPYMMSNVLALLTELSNSQVRAFRHTSTLAAMKLMTGLVNVALQISVHLDNTQRQYDNERGKEASRRASERLANLVQRRKELEEQQNDIESNLNGIFKGIYVHRYRDYIADIRALCMEEIGCWMRLFPKVFLTDSYLKYVGWTLHDKQKEVRMKCLQSLIGLYSNTSLMNDLGLFTSRFKDRIVSMVLDKEYDVSVQAIKLLVLIHTNCNFDKRVLSDTDCDHIHHLVYSCHRPVAVAAAEFLNIQLFQNKSYQPSYTKQGNPRGANTPHLTNLVLFYIDNELHEHATYLVDSLWEPAGRILKDWECQTSLLLEEPQYDQDRLDAKQETALVDVMVCSVKQAAEGAAPQGRGGYIKKPGSREKRLALEDRIRITEHFMVVMPALLSKFKMDKDKIAGLMQIPRYFDLEYYVTGRAEKHLNELLDEITDVIGKHNDNDVLEQTSTTLKYLCNDEYSIYDKINLKRRTICDFWKENFEIAFNIFQDAKDEADEEEVYNTIQSLKKLVHLYTFNDLTSLRLYDKVNEIFKMFQEGNFVISENLLKEAVKFLHFDVAWGVVIVKRNADNGLDVTSSENPVNIPELRQKVSRFLKNCHHLLSTSPSKHVQEECYMSVCDLLVMFSPQLATTSPMLKPLVQTASEKMQRSLLEFVRNHIFIINDDEDDEDDTVKIDALHKRRSNLAAICKLFVFSMIPLRNASVIFQQYIRFYSDYGDIIKETISKSRHENKIECAKALALSLIQLFHGTVEEQGGVLDQSSQEYAHMKELARRFALTFGLDTLKMRDAVAELHKQGINFGLQRDAQEMQNKNIAPRNLAFLGILTEFSSKLMRQDKKTVMAYLDKQIDASLLSNQDQNWIPLVSYRNSLLQGADDDKAQQMPKKRGRKKKKISVDQAQPVAMSTDDVGSRPMTPQQPMTPQRAMTPQRSMTPQQQPMTPGQPMTPQQHVQLQQQVMQQSMTSPAPSMTSHQAQGSMTPQSRSMTPQQPAVVMTPQQHPGNMTPQPHVAMTPQTVVMTPGVMTPQQGGMTPQQGGMTPSYQQHSTIIQQPHGVSMQISRGQMDETATSIGQPQLNSTVIQGSRTSQQLSYHDATQQNLLQSQLQAQMQQQAAIQQQVYQQQANQQQEFQLQQQQAYTQQQTVANSPMPQQQQGFIQQQQIQQQQTQQQMYDPSFHQNIQQTQSPFHGQYQN